MCAAGATVSEPLARRGGPVRGRIDRGVMRTQTPHINHFWPFVTLCLALVAVPLLTIALLGATAHGPRRFDTVVDDPWGDIEGAATEGLTLRTNDPLAIEAFFPRESYRPGTTAQLRFATTLGSVRLQVFHVGPEWAKTVGNMQMRGVPVTAPVLLGRIATGGTSRVTIGNWPTGLYFAQLTAPGGTDRLRAVRRPAEAPRDRTGSRSCCRRARGRPTTSATTTATAGATRGTPRAVTSRPASTGPS